MYFEYKKNRNKEGPKKIPSGFNGYLHTDGYDVYDDYDNCEHIVHLNCMVHARRYFVEAQKTDKQRAEYALEQIQQLYAIERECKDLPWE